MFKPSFTEFILLTSVVITSCGKKGDSGEIKIQFAQKEASGLRLGSTEGFVLGEELSTLKIKPIFSESHTAIWLTKDLWASKNGGGSFAIEPALTTTKRYLSGADECLSISPFPLTKTYLQLCQSLIQIYRCQPTAEYARQKLTNASAAKTDLSTFCPNARRRALSRRDRAARVEMPFKFIAMTRLKM
jgi:hypothetical protein